MGKQDCCKADCGGDDQRSFASVLEGQHCRLDTAAPCIPGLPPVAVAPYIGVLLPMQHDMTSTEQLADLCTSSCTNCLC